MLIWIKYVGYLNFGFGYSFYKNIAEFFDYFADDLNYTKERIAWIFGISTSHLYNLIKMKTYASLELAKRMSLFFNIPPESLMRLHKKSKEK